MDESTNGAAYLPNSMSNVKFCSRFNVAEYIIPSVDHTYSTKDLFLKIILSNDRSLVAH